MYRIPSLEIRSRQDSPEVPNVKSRVENTGESSSSVTVAASPKIKEVFLSSGSTILEYIAIDAAGNSSICSFVITVVPEQNVKLDSFSTHNICILSDPIPLPLGTPAGGIYSGLGTADGYFDPSIAGIGYHTIKYSFEEVSLDFFMKRSVKLSSDWDGSI